MKHDFDERLAAMKIEDDTRPRTKRGELGTIFWVGLAVALVSAVVLNAIGLFFMEFGDELCQQRPSGTILSDPSGWRCALRLQGVVIGVGLFGLYSLPYGLIVAWIAHRLRFFEYFKYRCTGNNAKWTTVWILLFFVVSIVGALVLMPVLLFSFAIFELMLIPVMASVSLGIGLLILIDCLRRQAPAGR